MSKHEKFILTPITSVVEEMVHATLGIDKGIESYSLWEYILQATFTKMTGFQEQKIKCIDWEIATNELEYRVKFVREVQNRGTYSKYGAKEDVYNILIDYIIAYTEDDKVKYIKNLRNSINNVTDTKINPILNIESILQNSNIINCKKRDYIELIKFNKFNETQYVCVPSTNTNKSNLLGNDLKKRYNELYNQRNRLAHNTLSYQQNLPDLEKLKIEDGLTRNYFFWFSLLDLIDEIFMTLYKDYMKSRKENSFFE